MAIIHCTLLIDDDPTTNYLNRWLIERLNITDQVQVAVNGHEALTILEAQFAAAGPGYRTLILLDINMPLMNGFDFLEAYQQLPLVNRQDIVIFMLTTSVHPRDMQHLTTLPVDGLLSKPLTATKVHDIVNAHFR